MASLKLPGRARTVGALVVATFASSCMVVPKTTLSYNEQCRAVQRQVTLEAQQVGAIVSCRNGGECAAQLAFYGVVGAASAVVSGSIAVVGNVAYWIEERGRCDRGASTERAPGPAPSALEKPPQATPARGPSL